MRPSAWTANPDPDLSPFELEIGAPVTTALGNVRRNLVRLFVSLFVLELEALYRRDGRTDGQFGWFLLFLGYGRFKRFMRS